MSNFDNFNWQSVEVDDDIITDEAGFLGLEVLDSSQVIVERVGDGWSMKSKKKRNRFFFSVISKWEIIVVQK